MTIIAIICSFTTDSETNMIWFDFNRCKLIIFCATSTAVFISIAAFCHLWNMFKRKRNSKNVAAHQEVSQDNNAGNSSMLSGLNSMYIFHCFCVKYV